MELDDVQLSVDFYCSHRMNLEDMGVLAWIKTGAVQRACPVPSRTDIKTDKKTLAVACGRSYTAPGLTLTSQGIEGRMVAVLKPHALT